MQIDQLFRKRPWFLSTSPVIKPRANALDLSTVQALNMLSTTIKLSAFEHPIEWC